MSSCDCCMPCVVCGGWTDGTGNKHPECRTANSELVVEEPQPIHTPECQRDIDCKACQVATLNLYEVAWQSAEDRVLRIINERNWSGESLDEDIVNLTRLILESGT